VKITAGMESEGIFVPLLIGKDKDSISVNELYDKINHILLPVDTYLGSEETYEEAEIEVREDGEKRVEEKDDK